VISESRARRRSGPSSIGSWQTLTVASLMLWCLEIRPFCSKRVTSPSRARDVSGTQNRICQSHRRGRHLHAGGEDGFHGVGGRRRAGTQPGCQRVHAGLRNARAKGKRWVGPNGPGCFENCPTARGRLWLEEDFQGNGLRSQYRPPRRPGRLVGCSEILRLPSVQLPPLQRPPRPVRGFGNLMLNVPLLKQKHPRRSTSGRS